MNNPKTTIFSFFSGAGFLDLGFENTGFEIAYVNEYHEPFLEAYKHSRTIMEHTPPQFGYDGRSIEELKPEERGGPTFSTS